MTTYAKTLPMKRILCLFVFIFFSLTQLSAQPAKSSLLWEISGNGLQHPSYLFGTFHMMCKEDFAITGILESKLKASEQFYGEIDMDQPNLQANMISRIMMQGKTLETLLGEDYKSTNEKFQSITGMSMAMLNNFKPFYCLSLLVINSTQCKESIQPEAAFTAVAKQNHLQIRGLETIDEQFDVIDKEPIDSQINALKKIVGNFDSVKTMMSQLMTVYKTKNIDSLFSFMKSTGANEDFGTELLDKRNKKWIPLMKKAMLEKASFFAVGAGHLGGTEGVISLLRKEGYRLTPVMY